MNIASRLRRKNWFLLQTALVFVLLLSIVVYLGRVIPYLGIGTWDWSGKEMATLKPESKSYLAGLKDRLSITYFVTPKKEMPSHLKGVESGVRILLQALQSESPESIETRTIYPYLSGDNGIFYASTKKASPFAVRDILQDEHSEEKVWSSLILAYGAHQDILIQKVTNSDLPYLEELIIRSLKARERPDAPTFAVSAPPSFTYFKQFIGQFGNVIEIDLDQYPRIPPNADVLFWFDPGKVTPEHQKELLRHIDSGKTTVLAGSPYVVDYENVNSQIQFRAYSMGTAWQNLLTPFGLIPRPDLLMDQRSGPVLWGDVNGGVHTVEAPFHLRVMPGSYNLKGFASQARGALNFVSAGPLEIEPRQVEESGFQIEILGSTTENAWISTLPQQPFTNANLSPGLAVGKQNVMIALNPHSPWRGQVLALASSSPFRDGILTQPNYGHRVFLQTLLRTFTQPQRLVRSRVDRSPPPPVPRLSYTSRVFWRGAAVFLIPIALLALGVQRYTSFGGQWSAVRSISRLPSRTVLLVILVIFAAQIWNSQWGTVVDLTEEGANTPAPFTSQLLSHLGNNGHIELVLSPRSALPVSMKTLEARTIAILRRLGLDPSVRRPQTLPSVEIDRLKFLGLNPFEVSAVDDDTEVTREIWSGLSLNQAGQSTVIPHLDMRSLDHLEFLLAAAARRIETGHPPHIGMIAELPRLSPAEAFEYQQKSLSAPKGSDVFSEIKALLRDYGYRITYINPQFPQLPADLDLLFWLQPRRDARRMTELLSQHLATGGKAIVAMQHFNIQQRQYRGSGFQTVYWPQPQFQDLERYLNRIGIEQVREVLMDRTKSRLSLETQINRLAVREYEAQEVTLPFLIRAIGPNFSPDFPMTRSLGDQLFIWGNRFALTPDSLKAAGIAVQSLISTSSQAWSFPWKGGWLPPEIFASTDYLSGHQSLAMLVKGTFPLIRFQGGDSLQVTPASGSREGSLILIGSSEMFKNDYLYSPGFQHDQLLLNTVAYLTHSGQLAELQARRVTARGFPYQSTDSKTVWRLLVIGLIPGLILLYGGKRYWQST